MQNRPVDPRLEPALRALMWGVLAAALVFLMAFTLANWGGVLRFFDWFGGSVGLLPQALQRIADHYAALPMEQALPSFLIGGLFGALTTAWVIGVQRKRWIILGMLLALPSSQILTLTTQHCTYHPEASFASQVIGVGLTVVGALIALLPYWTYLKRGVSSAFVAGYFRSRWLPYALLLPMLINLLIFLYYPSLQTVILSLFSRRFPLPQERFVCLDNYVRLVEDAVYQNSFVVTMALTVIITVISMALALSIALLVSQKIRFASVYRTLLIWPFALSPVVAGVIFATMFREGQAGLINSVVFAFTGTTLSLIRDVDLARVSIIAASVWNILGFNILFYVAGLQNVPADVLEAAQIDGANRVQRFWRVTFPLLAPFSFFLLVTNVTYAFYGIYGAIDTLTRGGPPLGAAGELGGATNVLIYKLYQDAFTPGSPAGLAAAQAVILFLLVAGLTVLQFRTVESRITYGE